MVFHDEKKIFKQNLSKQSYKKITRYSMLLLTKICNVEHGIKFIQITVVRCKISDNPWK